MTFRFHEWSINILIYIGKHYKIRGITVNSESLKMQKLTSVFGIEIMLIFTLFARLFLLVFGLKQLASVLFIIIHVLALLVGVKYVIHVLTNKQKKKAKTTIIVFMIMVIYIGAIYIINRSRPVSLEELPVTLSIVCLLAATLGGTTVSYRILKIYLRFSMVASILLILAAMIPSFYKNGSLLLYTANENQAGVIYMCLFMNMLVYWQMKKRFSVSYFAILFIAIGVFVGCCMTNSRTSIICCILTLLLWFVFKRKTKPFSSFTVMIIIALFVILPAVIVYVMPVLNIDVSEVFTGRPSIWEKVITESFANPLRANFTDPIFSDSITYGHEINAHNVVLELVWRYSLPIGFFFILFIYMLISKTNKIVGRDKASFMLFATTISALVHMCFEATLISGALDFSLYIILPLVMGANLEVKRENENE